ncbi:cupin domain-containing protein [Sulfurimonas indica]|uniref:cupin domain-containing protein n=1 Tax=Sulfurimonas indica TaxID=2508707 RepID=UPI0012657B33|nr:cupin domain-containing protein [Sulfurimonas indica]
MQTSNVFTNIPSDLSQEVFETLLEADDIRIERIISYGHTSPKEGWYDQEENEWVIVLEGSATLEFIDKKVNLKKGDFINIKAHEKHKVIWTVENKKTVWLAIFYK